MTFNIPVDAADRLRNLARHPNSVLRELGVLAVQIGSDNVMSLSDGGNSSNADVKQPDVVASSSSQGSCQSLASDVFSGSEQTVSQPVDSSVQQFKVPTMTMPSCCPNVLLPPSGASRSIAVEHPVRDVVPNVGQPRPIGLVRWPGVIAGCPGSDAVAVRFAVPSVPMKEFSPGLCFISPLRAAVSQSVASSSPLLVNLLQTRRQQGVTTVPCRPVVPFDTGALVLPQKRRRNNSTRKAKQPRNDQESIVPMSGLQLIADSTAHMAAMPAQILPITVPFAAESSSAAGGSSPAPGENEKVYDKSEESGETRHMINPYTGDLELVDIAEDDGLSMSVYSSTETSASHSFEASVKTAVVKSTTLLNSDQHAMMVNGLPSSMPNRLISPIVKVSESGIRAANGDLLTTSENTPPTEGVTVSSLVSGSAAATSLRHVDWYTASQSDKHNHLQRDAAQLLIASGMKQPEVVESVKFSNINVPGENLGISSSSIRAETLHSDDSRSLTMSPFCTVGQPFLSSLPKTCTVPVSCVESVKRKSCSSGIPPQSSNFSTVYSAVPQLNTSQTDLIQMAFTLAKQNGSALHASSLADSWTKNAGLLQNSLQSLHNIAVTTTGMTFNSLSMTTMLASCAQSGEKDFGGLNSTGTTTMVSSDKCFFPAVSCFPPEHRRKPAVNIGGLGINPESQLQTGTSGVVSSLVSTLPAVKMLTSATMPLEVKTCVVSVLPSTAPGLVTVNTSMGAESNLLSASTEQAPVPNTDVKKSIPLLTNLASSSWPLMPNLLTVPLVNPAPLSGKAPLSGSPLLHCVTRAPLTPDGKLASLSASVTNAKGSIVPLAGRFCISLSSSQAAPVVTSDADKQNIESTVTSGIRPHALMLTDNLARFKLSVPSNASKSAGKHGSAKDRRGSSTRADESTVQRGSSKSHLTVAQLLDMAKNARLQQTICDIERIRSSEQQNEPLSIVVTSASVQPQPALTISPPKNLLQLSSLPLQSSSVLLASPNLSQPQLMSVRLSSSAAGSSYSSPTASTWLQTSASPVCSQLSSSSSVISQPTTAVVSSTYSSHLSAQPLNAITDFSTVSGHLTAAAPVDDPGKVSTESAFGSDCLTLNAVTSSTSASLPVSSYLMQPPLPITSPRYPLNLTESVKKAMRGVGLYPSPPVSPTTPVQTFGSPKLPEIRPYSVSVASSVPVSELSAKRPVHDQSTLTLSGVSNSSVMSCVSRCGSLEAPVTSAVQQALTTASNCCALPIGSTTLHTEMIENQTTTKNYTVISQSCRADAHVAPVIAVGATSTTDCMQICDSLLVVSQSNAVRSESMTSKCSAYINTPGPTATRSVPNTEQTSSVFVENSSLHGHAVTTHSKLKDSLHITKTVNCLNGGLSASSGDSDMELRPDILEGLSSVETDAGFSSLHSSPCSAELANVPDSTKETNIAVANNAEVVNCITPVDHRHSCDVVPLKHDSCLHEGHLSLHCDRITEDGYTKAISLASHVTAVSLDNQVDAMATSSIDLPGQKAEADSSDMLLKYTLQKRNRLETDVTNVRSTARRKRPAELDANNSMVSDPSNNVDAASDQRVVTTVRCVTRMTTRSSQRTTASVTELSNNASSISQTKTATQKMPVKSPEKQGPDTCEPLNHTPDLDATKSIIVAQRRSTRTPVAKVADLKKAEVVTTCQDADSGVNLRSRRHAQKMNSVDAVTPRKRAGLRGMGVGKEDPCLGDCTENVTAAVDGSAGIEINVNDHEDSR